MKKIIAFVPADENNLKYFEMFQKSLRKFHSEEELPLKLIGPKELSAIKDPMKFYRMTPLIAKDLLEEYETVIKFDADSIVTGKLNHLWEGEFDVAVVNNSSPREMKLNSVQVWDIHPLAYVNCGLVVMRSKEFVKHWYDLCYSGHFQIYQYKEQDLLNILVWYGNYTVKNLDAEDTFNGLAGKGYGINMKLINGELVLPKGEEWPDRDKVIKVIHFAGGNDPNKGNYRIHYQPEVVEFLDNLTK